MELYQLVLKGKYACFGDKAEYIDRNIFKSRSEITDEYVNDIKNQLLNSEIHPIKYWSNEDPIKEYVQKLNLI